MYRETITGFWSAAYLHDHAIYTIITGYIQAPELTSRCWLTYLSCTVRFLFLAKYRKTSSIRRTLVGNKIVDHSDVVGASPVGAAPTTSSFST